MDNRERIRAIYDETEIPDALSVTVGAALKAKIRPNAALRAVLGTAAAIVVACTALLNFSPDAAEAAFDVPVLGDICRVLTFRHYDFEDEIKTLDVTVPTIDGTGNSELENRVNLEISRLIDEETSAAKINADEYYKAYIATGGDPAEYQPIEIAVDYEIKYIGEDIASFMIYKYESLASAYYTSRYYNLDLSTGRDLTLRDIYGDGYVQTVAAAVESGMASLPEETRALLFADTDVASLINAGRKFYYSADGQNVVVVFDKYELAAGAAGALEFTVPLP